MKNSLKNSLFTLFFLLATVVVAQEHHENKTEHESAKEPGWEAVLSGLVIHSPEHDITDLATELHITYWTTHKWAFGIGYSMVFEEHGRIGHELAGLVSHKPWHWLTVNAGPSFSLPNSHKDTEVSAYIETEFAFKLGEFHAGPTIGNLIGEDYRIFGGLHISYEF